MLYLGVLYSFCVFSYRLITKFISQLRVLLGCLALMFTELFLVVVKSNRIDWEGFSCLYNHCVGNKVRLGMRPDLARSTVKRYLSAKSGTMKVTVKVSLDGSFTLMLINFFAYSVAGLLLEVLAGLFFALVVLPVM